MRERRPGQDGLAVFAPQLVDVSEEIHAEIGARPVRFAPSLGKVLFARSLRLGEDLRVSQAYAR